MSKQIPPKHYQRCIITDLIYRVGTDRNGCAVFWFKGYGYWIAPSLVNLSSMKDTIVTVGYQRDGTPRGLRATIGTINDIPHLIDRVRKACEHMERQQLLYLAAFRPKWFKNINYRFRRQSKRKHLIKADAVVTVPVHLRKFFQHHHQLWVCNIHGRDVQEFNTMLTVKMNEVRDTFKAKFEAAYGTTLDEVMSFTDAQPALKVSR